MEFSPRLTLSDSTMQKVLEVCIWCSESTVDRLNVPKPENKGRHGECMIHSLQCT